MTIPHEPWLVVLSIAIAIQGSFVGLSLARELDGAQGFRRRLILAGSALTVATGVWSMHFVAMLAADFPSAVDYLVLPTLISFLICVIVVGAGIYATHAWRAPHLRIGVGGVAMGLGVSVMHYVGISAVHLAGPTWHEPPYVVASIAIAILASAFALWALDSRPTRSGLFLGAVALGLAISGMHYTAMAGMRLDPVCFDVSRFVGAEPTLSRNALAALATVVAFGVWEPFCCRLCPTRAPPEARSPPRRRSRRWSPTASSRNRPRSRLSPSWSLRRRPTSGPTRFGSRRTGGRVNSPCPRSTPSAPTPTTHTSTTARGNISARSRSARSRRASIRRRSSESTAATSSRSTTSCGSSDQARPAWPNSDCRCGAASRLRAPTIVR